MINWRKNLNGKDLGKKYLKKYFKKYFMINVEKMEKGWNMKIFGKNSYR